MRGSIYRMSAVLAIVCAGGLAACDKDGLQGAAAEVSDTKIQLDLPEPESFDMPAVSADGIHSVREMRLKGRKLFETEVKIRGYVTWIYDCFAELRKPEMTEKQVQKMIDEDPSLCNRPHFFIGQTAETAPEKSLWVVEVPRELRKDELKGLSRSDRANLPPVPVFKLGDEVVVTGTWNQTSPKGFANSDGLLVYQSMSNITATEAAAE